jgi:hypothetical protein
VGTPLLLYASVWYEKSLTVSGPFSVMKPIMELPPGPPWCHTTVGARGSAAPFCTSR